MSWISLSPQRVSETVSVAEFKAVEACLHSPVEVQLGFQTAYMVLLP